jgi:hypothetical protein
MQTICKVLASAALALLCCAGALRAEDTQLDKEAKAAAEEDAKEQAAGEQEQIAAQKIVGGLLALGDQGSENPDVVGSLATTATKLYLLKLADPTLMKKLVGYNGKQVSLMGKLRNQEKYLIVSAIAEATGSAAPDRKKRGGI